jgi:hypothetical protein
MRMYTGEGWKVKAASRVTKIVNSKGCMMAGQGRGAKTYNKYRGS